MFVSDDVSSDDSVVMMALIPVQKRLVHLRFLLQHAGGSWGNFLDLEHFCWSWMQFIWENFHIGKQQIGAKQGFYSTDNSY